MSKVKKKKIRWTPAGDSDIVAHRVFVAHEGDEIDTARNIYVEVPIGDEQSVILPDDFPPGTFADEGNYIVGICAVDDVGNEGDLALVASPFDFIAPGAPTDLIVENL